MDVGCRASGRRSCTCSIVSTRRRVAVRGGFVSVTIISSLPIVGPCAMGTPITTGGGSRDREIPRFRSPVRTIVGRARYIACPRAAPIDPVRAGWTCAGRCRQMSYTIPRSRRSRSSEMRGSACPATVFPSSDRRAISRRRGTIDEIASRAASSHGIRIHLHDSDPMFIRCGGRNNETRGIEHFRFTSKGINTSHAQTYTMHMEILARSGWRCSRNTSARR